MSEARADQQAEQQSEQEGQEFRPDAPEVEHQYVDREGIDFDPEDGLYTGTAVDGTSEIPGPHEEGPDTTDEDLAQSSDEGESTATF